MRPFIAFALEAFPQSGVRREALDATLADWRYEAAAASTGLGRLAVALRSTAAVSRAVLALAARDLATEWRRPWLRRLAVALALTFAAFGPLGPVDAALRIIPLFPLIVFVAEVTGHRERPAVGLGGALVLAVVSAWLVGVAVPELHEYRTVLEWRQQGRAWSLGELYALWDWERVMRVLLVAMHVVAGAALAGALRAGPHRGRRVLVGLLLIVAPLSTAFFLVFVSIPIPAQMFYAFMVPLGLLNVIPPWLAPVLTLCLAAHLRRIDQR